MTEPSERPLHLFAFFPGTNPETLWSHPDAGSQIDVDSFREFASVAEQGLFDAVFLAEGLRIHESNGAVVDHNVADRPDPVTRLSAVAASTDRIGLISTGNATHSEPFDLARRILSLDVLSGGRAGWNLVTASDDLIAANFRRGRFVPHQDRYNRAEDYLTAVQAVWNGRGEVDHRGLHVTISGSPSLPVSPQQRPILVQSGDSDEGRSLAAKYADAIFTERRSLDEGRGFYRDIERRLVGFGRSPDALKVMASTRFVLGENAADALDRAEYELALRATPALVRSYVEDAWGIDFPDLDVDSPLPSIAPAPGHRPSVRITTRRADAPRTAEPIVERWREMASSANLSARGLVIELLRSRENCVVGGPKEIAEQLIEWVDEQTCDGFVISPSVLPSGIGEFVRNVVPELQNRGRYRSEYAGRTLREHLGVADAPADSALS
ncbi:LLM class flavin-dependent oxidoreductase [Rhodococcus sp. B10]|uniref:LLM class flavin-dependent oxidoreductase n=1 Tax=Rhodococcus sp. B10 TaxID=2695876 RepID=UPI001431E91F|nr:LLM class flavin-dependent oxidoreductase [Rhodococcus sp. B10]NIL77327.1 Nitrilotriacetate monooxygenase component A [Rhodococcus sp. B10]